MGLVRRRAQPGSMTSTAIDKASSPAGTVLRSPALWLGIGIGVVGLADTGGSIRPALRGVAAMMRQENKIAMLPYARGDLGLDPKEPRTRLVGSS
jgi:hypothetical protein